ncbi:MAG: hypothetical protein KIT84_07480 [Labilithrix sp.]|nr:hypothetical protein [Labilithrix sp.]MCW5810836.1 hypothetical protein [Labilithrix sp.]
MRTPTPHRSVNTLIGNGWLKESPRNLWPRGWDIKSRSALKKCVFLPIPPDAQAFLNSLPPAKPIVAAPSTPAPRAKRPDTPPFRRDPARHAKVLPAMTPEDLAAIQRRKLHADAQRAAAVRAGHGHGALGSTLESNRPRAWYEDPIALGTLLIMVPPIGLAALWSSKRYSSDARWALTVMTGLTLCLGAAVVVALTALAR